MNLVCEYVWSRVIREYSTRPQERSRREPGTKQTIYTVSFGPFALRGPPETGVPKLGRILKLGLLVMVALLPQPRLQYPQYLQYPQDLQDYQYQQYQQYQQDQQDHKGSELSVLRFATVREESSSNAKKNESVFALITEVTHQKLY